MEIGEANCGVRTGFDLHLVQALDNLAGDTELRTMEAIDSRARKAEAFFSLNVVLEFLCWSQSRDNSVFPY